MSWCLNIVWLPPGCFAESSQKLCFAIYQTKTKVNRQSHQTEKIRQKTPTLTPLTHIQVCIILVPVLVILSITECHTEPYVYIVMSDSRNRKGREKHTCLLSTYQMAAVQFHSVTVLQKVMSKGNDQHKTSVTRLYFLSWWRRCRCFIRLGWHRVSHG